MTPGGAGMGFMPPSVHGGGDGSSGIGLVGLLDSLLEKLTGFLGGGSSFELFPGIKTLGLNVHPLLVHFPIALLTTFFLLDVLGVSLGRPNLRRVAGWMLYLGAPAAVCAAAAGLYAAATVPHGEAVHEIMEWHERLGLTVTTLSLVLAGWRLAARGNFSSMANALHLLLATLMMACLVFGADLGGFMVYGNGVAVKRLQQPDAHHHHEALSDSVRCGTKPCQDL